MKTYPDSAGLMFPATVDTKIETNVDPHVTLLYLGEIADLKYTPVALLHALKPYRGLTVGEVRPKSFEFFGRHNEDLVVEVADPLLPIVRSLVEKVLSGTGAENASEFKEYRPHVTLIEDFYGDIDNLELPSLVTLGPLEIWWGDDRITI